MTSKNLKPKIAIADGNRLVSGTLDFEVACVSARKAPVVMRGPRNLIWRHHENSLWRPVRTPSETRSRHYRPDITLVRDRPDVLLGIRLLAEAPIEVQERMQLEAALGVPVSMMSPTKASRRGGNLTGEPFAQYLLRHASNFLLIDGDLFERSAGPQMALRYHPDATGRLEPCPPDPLTPFWIEPTGITTFNPGNSFWIGTNLVGFQGAPLFNMFGLPAIQEIAEKQSRQIDRQYLDQGQFEVLDFDLVQASLGDAAQLSVIRLGRALLSELIEQRVRSVPMRRLRAAHELRRVFKEAYGADPVTIMIGMKERFAAFDGYLPFNMPELIAVVSEAIRAIEEHPFRKLELEAQYQLAVSMFNKRTLAPTLAVDDDLADIGFAGP